MAIREAATRFSLNRSSSGETVEMFTRRHAIGFLAAALVGLAGAFAGPGTVSEAAERVPFDRAVFEAALAGGGPILIDVSASWCPTCRRQGEIVDGLVSTEPYADFTIFVVDYDTEKDVMRSFGATQRSTLIVFRGGRETGRIVGDTRPRAIEALLGTAV